MQQFQEISIFSQGKQSLLSKWGAKKEKNQEEKLSELSKTKKVFLVREQNCLVVLQKGHGRGQKHEEQTNSEQLT